jgi:hypothetical protein
MKNIWMAGLVALFLVGGVVGQLSQSVVTAGPVGCDSSAIVTLSTAATTQAVVLGAGKSVHVCGFLMNADGKTTAKLVQGMGTNCATGQSNLTPAFNVDAGANVQLGGGIGRLVKSNAGSAVCVTSSASKTLNVLLIYTQF